MAFHLYKCSYLFTKMPTPVRNEGWLLWKKMALCSDTFVTNDGGGKEQRPDDLEKLTWK